METLNRTFGFERYKENLRIDVITNHNTNKTTYYVVSYDTRVATLDFERKEVNKLEWVARDKNTGKVLCTSRTTNKHINYVAQDFNFKVVSQF